MPLLLINMLVFFRSSLISVCTIILAHALFMCITLKQITWYMLACALKIEYDKFNVRTHGEKECQDAETVSVSQRLWQRVILLIFMNNVQLHREPETN